MLNKVDLVAANNPHLPVGALEDGLHVSAGGRVMALTLLLPEGRFAGGNDINDRVNEALTSGGYDPLARGYAGNQLRKWPPDTIRVKPPERRQDSVEFAATPTMIAYQGLALRCALLAQDHEIAPVDLVGPRAQARSDEGVQPYFARWALYKALQEEGVERPVAITDLSRSTGLNDRVTHNHVPALLRSGVVQGISDGRRSDYPTYTLKQDEGAPALAEELRNTHWRQTTQDLTRYCLDVLSSGQAVTIDGLRKRITENGGLELVQSRQPWKQNELLSKVMEWLEQQGVVDEVKPARERTTHLALTPEGSEVIGRYLDILSHFASRDPQLPSLARQQRERFVNNDDALSWLLSADFDAGAIGQRIPHANSLSSLLSILQGYPDGITTTELIAITGIKTRTLHNRLDHLRREGRVAVEPDGRKFNWKPVNPGHLSA